MILLFVKKEIFNNMLLNIYRYDLQSSYHMEINANGRFFESYFCDVCGNYIYFEENYNEKIICLCDKIPKIFKNYREFIEEIPDITSGDELDDYIEYPEDGHPDFVKYIYNMVLFGITYNKPYYNSINNDIVENILSYTI